MIVSVLLAFVRGGRDFYVEQSLVIIYLEYELIRAIFGSVVSV